MKILIISENLLYLPLAPGSQQAVTVNCELANTLVTIIYSEQLKSNYSDYHATVSTQAGSLTFGKDEIRAGYFQPLPINISVELTWQKGDGPLKVKRYPEVFRIPCPKRNMRFTLMQDLQKDQLCSRSFLMKRLTRSKS